MLIRIKSRRMGVTMGLKEWWNSLRGHKGVSSSSVNPTLTSLGVVRELESQGQPLLQQQGLQVEQEELVRPKPLPSDLEPLDSQLSRPRLFDLPSLKDWNAKAPTINLYWCAFMTPSKEFIGVVICYGETPNSAADWAIRNGIVESERAQIVMIPKNREAEFRRYEKKLLSLSDILAAFPLEPFVRNYLDNSEDKE